MYYPIKIPPKWSAELEFLGAKIMDEAEEGETVEDYDFGAPSCCGFWIDGSGGHRRHLPRSCQNSVLWWSPSEPYSYCEEHVDPGDKDMFLEDWRKIYYRLMFKVLFKEKV